MKLEPRYRVRITYRDPGGVQPSTYRDPWGVQPFTQSGAAARPFLLGSD